jgi:ribose 5-phosphate isomerase A
MADPFAVGKRAAGRAAADLVESRMRLGLGTGSTVEHVLDRLAERQREGLQVVGVPTSEATAARARALGLPLCSLDDVEQLDLALDGADEVDEQLDLIKGGGGARTREKIVAAAASLLVIVVSANKVVDRLGAFPLPVEVLPFGWRVADRALRALGTTPRLRQAPSGKPVVTDNGNWVLDCPFPAIARPGELHAAINSIPGVLDCGLFVGMAHRVLVGEADGSVRELARA